MIMIQCQYNLFYTILRQRKHYHNLFPFFWNNYQIGFITTIMGVVKITSHYISTCYITTHGSTL